MSYSLHAYGRMIDDTVRITAYRDALAKVIRPGDVVLELGTGPGIVAFLARELGARRVYAVEPDVSIEVARAVARDLHVPDEEVTFIRALSTDIDLPEKVDILLSDMRGTLGLLTFLIPSIVDARARHLKDSARQIAASDDFYCALVDDTGLHRDALGPWRERPLGVDLRAAHTLAQHIFIGQLPAPESLRSAPARWAHVDYRTVTSPHVSGEVVLTANADTKLHGLALWFATNVDDDIRLDNAPGLPRLAYGGAFFPFPDAIEARAGDEVRVQLSARLVDGTYIWRWRTTHRETRFDQSTFHAQPLSLVELNDLSGARAPARTPRGDAALFVLERIGAHKVPAITAALVENFTDFDAPAAERFVLDLVERYGRWPPQ